MTNKIRGEVHVPLNGHPAGVVLRPTFEALAEVEDRIGRGVICILQDISGGNLRLKDTVEVVDVCAVEKISRKDVEDGVMRTGIVAYVQPISELLMAAIGGNLGEGEKDPSPGTESGK